MHTNMKTSKNTIYTIAGVLILIIVVAVVYMRRYLSLTGANSTGTTLSQQEQGVGTTSPQANMAVNITAGGFTPQTLAIKSGTTVTWTNTSGGDVSINSDPHPTHTLYPPLNLGRVSDGGSVSLTFNKAGSYGYHNHLNPAQKGTIVVQ